MQPKAYRIATLFLIGIILVITGCNRNRPISKKEMARILKDFYLVDGTVYATSQGRYADSIDYYSNILESHGYTRAQFDSSLKYYSAKTDEFNDILDRVIMELQKMEDKYIDKKLSPPNQSDNKPGNNLWPHSTTWDMATDYTKNPSLGFDLPLCGAGKYTLSFDAQFFPDDSSKNCRMYIFFYLENNTPEGVRIDPILKSYPKDGKIHHYSFTLTLKDQIASHLKGWLYDQGNPKPNFKRHAIFSNISITHQPPDSPKLKKIKTYAPRRKKNKKDSFKEITPLER